MIKVAHMDIYYTGKSGGSGLLEYLGIVVPEDNTDPTTPVEPTVDNPLIGFSLLEDNYVSFINPNGDEGIWYFGDGKSSTEINPSYQYLNKGSYQPVFIKDNSSIYTLSIIIESNLYEDPPTPSFTYVTTEGFVQLTAIGADRYEWVIDETNYNGNYVEVEFSSTGVYEVTLIGYNSQDVSVSVVENISVVVPVEFTVDYTITNLTVQAVTSLVEDNGEEYYYNFGDNLGSSSEALPSYTYTENGTYTITLIFTNSEGVESVYTNSVTVVGLPSEEKLPFTWYTTAEWTRNE